MKELRGTASEVVAAPQDRCIALLEAADRYPEWHPEVVKSVEVLERDPAGRPSKVRALLRVERQPLVKEFDVVLAVIVDRPRAVDLTLVRDDHLDPERFGVAWRLEPQNGTRIRLDLSAHLDVPRFLPVGGIGDWVARGFVAAAAKQLG